jgi:hypothetical protein
MVTGYELFKKAMSRFSDNFIIIGGTACDVSLADTGRTRHVTKDIDLIVIVENLTTEFIKNFWQFIRNAGYTISKRENKVGEKIYALYRFNRPVQKNYPWQIELLSRQSDFLKEPTNKIEPLTAEDCMYSLSAIIMDDDLYQFVVQHSEMREGLRMADEYALICMKMRAYLNLKIDKENGEQVDDNDIKKHRRDVFNLLATGKVNESVVVTQTIYETYQAFVWEMNNLNNENPKVLPQSLGVNPIMISEYFDLLNDLFVLEK